MLDKDAILGEEVVTQNEKLESNIAAGGGGGNEGGKTGTLGVVIVNGSGVSGAVIGKGNGKGSGDGDYLEERMFVGADQGADRTGVPPPPSILPSHLAAHIHHPNLQST